MLTLDFSHIRLVCLIAWFWSRIKNTAQANQVPLPSLISGYAWSIRHMPDQNQAAPWLIRLLPDQNQAAAWSIKHMPDQNQVAAWSTRLLSDQNQTCLISGKPVSLINPAQANQAIRQTKEICEKSIEHSGVLRTESWAQWSSEEWELSTVDFWGMRDEHRGVLRNESWAQGSSEEWELSTVEFWEMKAKHIKVLKFLALTGREWGHEEGRKK